MKISVEESSKSEGLSPSFYRGRCLLVSMETYWISVLIASRGNPLGLVESVRSIYKNALCKERVEVIIKVDDDDIKTSEVAIQLKKEFRQITIFSSPRGNGYKDLGMWLNQMAAMSRGCWLFPFNDNAVMLTRYWDLHFVNTLVIGAPGGIWGFALLVEGRPRSNEFIVIRREVFEVLGYMTQHPNYDTWMFTILTMIQMLWYTNVEIRHDISSRNKDLEDKGGAWTSLLSKKEIQKKLDVAHTLLEYMSKKVLEEPPE